MHSLMPLLRHGMLFLSSCFIPLVCYKPEMMCPEHEMSDKVASKPPVLASIALGGCAAVFTVNFTHPIELMKTRLQVYGTVSPFAMIKNEGVLAFWKGIQPAWGRESFYASIKIGGYGPIREALGASDKGL